MKRFDWILIGAIALASSAWCVTSSQRLGATFDEPFYLEAGLDYWHSGRFTELLSAGVMPLAAHVQTLPVYVAERRAGRTFSIQNDLGEMLRLARPVTLVFWWLLLFSVMRLGRLFGGLAGGRAALLLIAAEPNFLAHASLATTDIPLAACFAAFTAQFLAGRDSGPLRRIWLPAIWLGLAIAAKVSALALLPFAVLAAALRRPPTGYRRLAIDSFVMLAGGLIFVVLYCGTGGQTWLHGTLSQMPPDYWLRPAVEWLGSLPVFPNAIYALWFQLAHNATGQAVFINGVASTHALWIYVPLLLTIKLPLALLAAIALAVATAPARRTVLLVACGALAFVMIAFRVQTGVRFLLPLLAIAIAWTGARIAAHRRVLAAVIVLIAIESLVVWPDGLRYVNQAWGGTSNGYRIVSDSNYDWGQGLPELERWRVDHHASIAVWYFGTDTRFPDLIRYNPRTAGSDPNTLKGRLLAVSTSFVEGGYLETPDAARDLMLKLRAIDPVDRTSTFLIFDTGY